MSHHCAAVMTTVTSNVRLLFLLVCAVLISLHLQGDSSSHSELFSSTSAPPQEDFSNRRDEQRKSLRRDEFWLIDSDTVILPFDVDYTPPDDSFGSFDPLWSCDDEERPKKLVFVNIVRSDAMRVQELLKNYAKQCHAGFLSVAMCSGLSWASMISGTWANRRLKGGDSVTKCPVQSAMTRGGSDMSNKTKVVLAPLLEHSIDLLAGQVPLGCADKWIAQQQPAVVEDIPLDKKSVEAQYIVSLRHPQAWFVSSMIDKLKLKQQQHAILLNTSTIVAAIQEKVTTDLDHGFYHEVYARYLITPSQISWIQKEDADVGIQQRVDISLSNLKSQNAVIVLAEYMDESLEKIRHLIGLDYSNEQQLQQPTVNPEEARVLQTVLDALHQDKAFYGKFQNYLQYEQKIYKQAKDMHERQLKWVRKQ
ncbi:expressed unknown protein [Seminavis robusta]|uniref:Uncharacterized protein n=1 Tax=Seminavis robusta TaxID=568900 RepID=A0A9N8EF13_9STRA|nr:expressed unknown protein [Seminavis robusta]|eukprot:Sro982_g227660.1 n/a (421) ;mRNA; r:17206-18586